MTVQAEVKPELLVWARERSGLTAEDLASRFPRLEEWERGDRTPTLRQNVRCVTPFEMLRSEQARFVLDPHALEAARSHHSRPRS